MINLRGQKIVHSTLSKLHFGNSSNGIKYIVDHIVSTNHINHRFINHEEKKQRGHKQTGLRQRERPKNSKLAELASSSNPYQ